MNIPYNIEYTIGEDLREVPTSKEEMKLAILFLEEKEKASEDLTKILGLKGELQRIIGDYKKSVSTLLEALKISNDEKNRVANKLRLAIAFYFDGQMKKADALFLELIQVCSNNQDTHSYLDFVFQHRGKYLLQCGDIKEAKNCFEKAMKLRLKKGNHSLINSTKVCLSKIKSFPIHID
jgi:tetratricopeptide (TPR) repeat protein